MTSSTITEDTIKKLEILAIETDATTTFQSSDDFLFGTTEIDFEKLKKEFKAICEDYLDPLTKDTKSKAVEFCSKILYEVGPEARQMRKRNENKIWPFVFNYKKSGKIVTKVAFVSSHMSNKFDYEQKNENSYNIVLSITDASLLAIPVLEQLNYLSINKTPPTYLLTPLAGAVFAKEDIEKIATDVGTTVIEVINVINASCQPGGQYLTNSRMYCAAVASFVSTKYVKDEKMRKHLIDKNLKQYISAKKHWQLDMFEKYCKYGCGGIPSTIPSSENLIELFESIQKVSLSATVEDAKSTTFNSVTAPNPETTGPSSPPTGRAPSSP